MTNFSIRSVSTSGSASTEMDIKRRTRWGNDREW